MKMIVGLGNPGKEYEKTKHNLGFLFLEYLEEKYNLKISKKLFDSLILETNFKGEKVVFVKPQTYMNLSGIAVKKVKQFYKINDEDIIVIYDDIDIPFEVVRYRKKGSAGSHNGMKNILEHLGTENFSRIRIGLGGLKNEHQDLKDFVLQRFTKEQLEKLTGVFFEVEEKLDEFLLEK